MKNARSEIEAVLIRHAKAIRDKNAEALMACLTEDMTCFDLAPPLVQNPAATHDHTGYKAWFETWDGLIEIASSDLSVEAKDDVGWVSSLSHMTGRKTDGNDFDLWYRTMMIPTKVGHGFRFEVGPHSEMMSATSAEAKLLTGQYSTCIYSHQV